MAGVPPDVARLRAHLVWMRRASAQRIPGAFRSTLAPLSSSEARYRSLPAEDMVDDFARLDAGGLPAWLERDLEHGVTVWAGPTWNYERDELPGRPRRGVQELKRRLTPSALRHLADAVENGAWL